MDSPCPSCGLLSTVETTKVDGILYCPRCNCAWVDNPDVEDDEPRERRDLA